jgi:hypothetical protein
MAELEITEPLVTMEINRAACLPGEAVEVYCKLNHIAPFDGEATAELLGMPPHATVQPVKFTRETPELKFQVQTTANSPVGKHPSLFCRVTITRNAEQIVSTAGSTELQINPPPPVPQEAPPAEAAPVEVAKPAEKPLSRLEQLRESARKK